MGDCCLNSLHAQISYEGREGAVESLLGVGLEDRELLHQMLDEYLDKRQANKYEDHFIVFGLFPKELR